jgi:peptide/nickel transport system permease protein
VVPAVILVAVWVAALLAPWLCPYPYYEMHSKDRFRGPCLEYPLGTDRFGRDLLSRVLMGARVSYGVGLGAVLLATVGGVLMGLAGGLSRVGGFITMRVVDVLLCFPTILVAVIVISLTKPGVATLIGVIGFLYAPRVGRVIQGAVLEIKTAPFLEAQRAIGASSLRIVFTGVLPQLVSPILVQASAMLATAMIVEAGLSFLGMGVPPPMPSWGSLVSEARMSLQYSVWLLVIPAFVLALNIVMVNTLGDALRDRLDPRMRRR